MSPLHDESARLYTSRSRHPIAGLALGLVVALGGVACGAATGLDSDPPSKGAPEPQPEPRPSGSSRPGSNSPGSNSPGGRPSTPGGQSGVDLPSFELGECELGERPNRVEECPYLAEGLCYEDVQSACACICPRDKETFCFEGLFLNVWNGVDVRCAER